MPSGGRLATLTPVEPFDVAFVSVLGTLTLATAASFFVPGAQVRIEARQLDLVLDTLTTVVAVSVAVLGWIRYRERHEPVAAFQAAAFLVLSVANVLDVTLVTLGLDAQAGMSLASPGQEPLYVFTAARLLAAALLVLGGVASLRGHRVRHAGVLVLGAALLMCVLVVLFQAEARLLPSLGSVGPLDTAGTAAPLPAPTLLGATTQVVAAALFLGASGLSRRLYLRDRSIVDGYLSVGLVFAALAQMETVVVPGTYTGLVTSGDVMRLAFDVILLFGIQAEAGSTLAHLREANLDLARLQAVELERAALAERARLSRELHDGLAQDLWLAKLKAGRLAALPDLGSEASLLTGELDAAIDAGLAEARQAVAAMRLAGEPAGTLRELLTRSVDDFADRFGLRVEFDCDADLPDLPSRAQAEALRVMQEALSNVRRHADATLVRVRAGVEDRALVVVVGDNGRGFDPDAVGQAAYGIASMRERAALAGGELRIESAPQDGTRVMLRVPLGAAAIPA